MASSTVDTGCLPGDVTVTKIPSGYLIGRALEQLGPGPWWEYILIVSTFEEARAIATKLASGASVRAWLQMQGDRYVQLPAGAATPDSTILRQSSPADPSGETGVK